jgi:hypothetical protein
MKIFLTAPHGNAFLNDVIAPHIVGELSRILGKDGHDVSIFVNQQPRSYGDMNRPSTRGTPWRKNLEYQIKLYRPDFLLDVHGFPDNTDSSLHGYDMVVLNSYPKIQGKLPETYHSLFKDPMIKVGLQEASLENDIVKRSFELGTPAVLVEHNESGPVGRYALAHARAINSLSLYF